MPAAALTGRAARRAPGGSGRRTRVAARGHRDARGSAHRAVLPRRFAGRSGAPVVASQRGGSLAMPAVALTGGAAQPCAGRFGAPGAVAAHGRAARPQRQRTAEPCRPTARTVQLAATGDAVRPPAPSAAATGVVWRPRCAETDAAHPFTATPLRPCGARASALRRVDDADVAATAGVRRGCRMASPHTHPKVPETPSRGSATRFSRHARQTFFRPRRTPAMQTALMQAARGIPCFTKHSRQTKRSPWNPAVRRHSGLQWMPCRLFA